MLICFDIDGTLIEDTHEIPESAKEAMREAQARGHKCVINTGRTASLVTNWLPQQFPFDGYLCGCGTHILYQGMELSHKVFTEEESLDIIEALESCQIDAILEGCDNDYHNPLDRLHSKDFYEYITRHQDGKGWGTYQDAVGKFEKFFCYAGSKEQIEAFQSMVKVPLDCIDRENGYYEVVPQGYSKATAMELLVQKIGISMDDTAAIGDSNNDIPMLERAHYAIAMGKSTKEVLALADYVTTTVGNHGIKNALQWLGVTEK